MDEHSKLGTRAQLRWTETRIIMLSVRSPTQKDKYCVLLSLVHLHSYVGVRMHVCACVGHEAREGTMERERVRRGQWDESALIRMLG